MLAQDYSSDLLCSVVLSIYELDCNRGRLTFVESVDKGKFLTESWFSVWKGMKVGSFYFLG